MKVSVVQGGGLAGLVRTTSVDSDSMPADQAAAFEDAVGRAGAFDLPATLGSSVARPDEFIYEVTVDDGRRRHTVRARRDALSAGLRSLISWVQSAPGRSERYDPPGGK